MSHIFWDSLYLCDNCEYAATSAGSLNCHIENKYEGVRYPCDKWEYAATETGSLKQHIESYHEGVGSKTRNFFFDDEFKARHLSVKAI